MKQYNSLYSNAEDVQSYACSCQHNVFECLVAMYSSSKDMLDL